MKSTSFPLVSIIIPTYEREELLKRALRSVNEQTYPSLEIIIVDDSPERKDDDFFQSFHPERITYIYREYSRGANSARNLGVKEAKGEYLAFLDDDDEWLPTKIEKQVQCLLKYPDCVMSICYSQDLRFGQVRVCTPKKIVTYKDLIKSFNLSSTSSYLIRKYPLLLLGGFDETLQSGQEYDMALRLLKKLSKYHHIRTVPEVLMIQHQSTGQISENWGRKIRGGLQLARKHHHDYEIIDYVKTLCVLGLFSMGFFVGNRIYQVIIPVKRWYERR